IPGKNSFLVNAPYEPVPVHLQKPINLRNFIESRSHLLLKGPVPIYEPPQYSTHVLLYGEGKYALHTDDYELLDDSYAVLEASNVERLLESLSMTLCLPRSKWISAACEKRSSTHSAHDAQIVTPASSDVLYIKEEISRCCMRQQFNQ
ncbi:hypothetical protein ANCDUO_15995, partial [Ancylostoma duodenale]